MHYHAIIIGAGPAGLFAAHKLGKQNKKVLLLERNSQAGKKLLLSGSGQCNFTHDADNSHFLEKYGDNSKFLKKALELLDSKGTMKFFETHGLRYQVMENGKVFPKSMKAQDVLGILLLQCKKQNVTTLYNQCVENISVYDNIFTIETADGNRYFGDQVIVATGGVSYPNTGSDGKGLELAKSLGHKVVEPKPALTYVTTHEKTFAAISGIAFQNAKVTLLRSQKKLKERVGSVLFTHKGLSGPAILDSSRWIQAGDELEVNYMYPKTYEEVKKTFAQEVPKRGTEEIGTFLRGQDLPKSFCAVICQAAGIDEHHVCARLSKAQRELLVKYLTKCTFSVSGLGGYHIAMATAGGVSLKDVNPTTMESRKQKGLYFIGEVLDIDGDTGGYNIQAAFSMGALCAKHIEAKSQSHHK
ncbi:MAG: NAD(P)/FAD-dependent oxidoreductase [Cellulosilyticaceae bacterium]